LLQRRAANRSFNRARSRGSWRAFVSRLMGRSTQLQGLTTKKRREASGAVPSVQVISLEEVVGSEGRSQEFDDQFWPLKEHSRDRWMNIALAMRGGTPLPPVQLVKTAGGYVVRDGHHRLSVARALGRAVIEAEIV
jgi:hypothetical protein